MTDEMLDQFQLFFSDKNNVNMSSYKVDQKTGLPILYLKDNKKALWNKYLELYPNGMKRSSFMVRLQNGQFKYKEDWVDYVQFVMNMVMMSILIF